MTPAPHQFQVHVHYEDTDMGGLVYHANYLKFIERARSDWVRGLGLDQRALLAQGIVFVVHRIEADFRAPARFDDDLTVVSRPVAGSRARLVLDQRVLDRHDRVVFEARVTLACMGTGGRPRRLPPPLSHISDTLSGKP